MCLHYGQEIFEGLKAYRGPENEIYFFRPQENIKRMNASAEKLCMPAMDEDLFMEAMKKLVILEKDWIPRGAGTSMYIRPAMIATEAALGVHPSSEYLFLSWWDRWERITHRAFLPRKCLFPKNTFGLCGAG